MTQREPTAGRIASREHYDRLDLLGWAMLHEPTREAYRRSTGENIAPAIDRYREWVEENVIGRAVDGSMLAGQD